MTKTTTKTTTKKRTVVIAPLKWQAIRFQLEGTNLYVQAARKRKNEPYRTQAGWYGLPTIGLRLALIEAGKLLGFAKSRLKLALFVEPEGFDVKDSMPLYRVVEGQFRPYDEEDGAEKAWEKDAMVLDPGWRAEVVIRYDAAVISPTEVVRVVGEAGSSCGLGAHRPGKGGELGRFTASA